MRYLKILRNIWYFRADVVSCEILVHNGRHITSALLQSERSTSCSTFPAVNLAVDFEQMTVSRQEFIVLIHHSSCCHGMTLIMLAHTKWDHCLGLQKTWCSRMVCDILMFTCRRQHRCIHGMVGLVILRLYYCMVYIHLDFVWKEQKKTFIFMISWHSFKIVFWLYFHFLVDVDFFLLFFFILLFFLFLSTYCYVLLTCRWCYKIHVDWCDFYPKKYVKWKITLVLYLSTFWI